MISARSCDFSSRGGGKKHSVFVGQVLKWPFRGIPQALKAARTLLPANCGIVGVEGKVDPLEEHHSSWVSRKSWRLYGVWGGVIICLGLPFLFLFYFHFWRGRRNILVI